MALVGVIALASDSQATVVVGRRTSDSVVFGIDSLTVRSGRDPTAVFKSCKMRQAAPTRFVMISGNAGHDDINLLDVASASLSSGATFADGVHAARDAVGRALGTIVLGEPALRLKLRTAPPLSSLYVFGLDEKGTPAVHIWRFEWRENPTGITMLVDAACPPNCGPTGEGTFTSGDSGAANRYLNSHRGYFARAARRPSVGIEGAIGKLLRMGIMANPSECGPPLTIVRVTAGGVRIKYGQCDEKKRTKVALPGGAPR